MISFYNGEYDLLLCTTIIENGLDVPRANTIIIQGAENFGLSQLYQMRGRVGRSSKLAYAYLVYKKQRALSEIAQKRLQAIRDLQSWVQVLKLPCGIWKSEEQESFRPGTAWTYCRHWFCRIL